MKALLIIDIQNDYFPGGKSELAEPVEAAKNAASALRRFRERSLPVIHVQHINIHTGAAFLLPDTDGAQIYPSVTPLDGERLVLKHTPNGFFKTDLLDIIKGFGTTETVVCGMMTHMCIDTTVRAAHDYGLPVTLLHDACATKDLTFRNRTVPAAQVQAAFMAALSGRFAEVIAAEELVL
ncbi:MAG: cysteine hydrolase [Synergistaceae bacterium]|jgi:nicotinamidase-related amidase|nr:cysteine hydrolase [Synergistaceae bacterium]